MYEIKRNGYFYSTCGRHEPNLANAQAVLAAKKLSALELGFEYYAPCSSWRDMLRVLREVEAYDGLAGE